MVRTTDLNRSWISSTEEKLVQENWWMPQILLNHSYLPLKNKSVQTCGSCMRPNVQVDVGLNVKYMRNIFMICSNGFLNCIFHGEKKRHLCLNYTVLLRSVVSMEMTHLSWHLHDSDCGQECTFHQPAYLKVPEHSCTIMLCSVLYVGSLYLLHLLTLLYQLF